MSADQAADVGRVLATLLGELLDGSRSDAGWVLNPGDRGLLASLDRLSAAEASAPAAGGGPPIAAHVDHLRYGIHLLNRWSQGEEPFAGADYAASWDRTSVSEAEWIELRSALRQEADRWRAAVRTPRALDETALTGMLASAAHLAYHFGAIRQANRALRGPQARD